MSRQPLKTRVAGLALVSVGIAIGALFAGDLAQPIQAQEGSAAKDNMPIGRTPQAIANGQHPASYFPNTELLAPDEMRITALGTGLPTPLTRAPKSTAFGS